MPPEIVGAVGTSEQSPGTDTFVIDDVEIWGEQDGFDFMHDADSSLQLNVNLDMLAFPRELDSAAMGCLDDVSEQHSNGDNPGVENLALNAGAVDLSRHALD